MKNNIFFGTCAVDSLNFGWVFCWRDDLHTQIEIVNNAKILFETDFVIHGSNYTDKKEHAKKIITSTHAALLNCQTSFWERSLVCEKLFLICKRYGLIKEFRKKGIL